MKYGAEGAFVDGETGKLCADLAKIDVDAAHALANSSEFLTADLSKLNDETAFKRLVPACGAAIAVFRNAPEGLDLESELKPRMVAAFAATLNASAEPNAYASCAAGHFIDAYIDQIQ